MADRKSRDQPPGRIRGHGSAVPAGYPPRHAARGLPSDRPRCWHRRGPTGSPVEYLLCISSVASARQHDGQRMWANSIGPPCTRPDGPWPAPIAALTPDAARQAKALAAAGNASGPLTSPCMHSTPIAFHVLGRRGACLHRLLIRALRVGTFLGLPARPPAKRGSQTQRIMT